MCKDVKISKAIIIVYELVFFIFFFKHPYSDYEFAILFVIENVYVVKKWYDEKEEKKRTHEKEKMKHEKKEKKKIWCDWIWCNVTKILRINRKQKMWYENHHKIFRKDAFVT